MIKFDDAVSNSSLVTVRTSPAAFTLAFSLVERVFFVSSASLGPNTSSGRSFPVSALYLSETIFLMIASKSFPPSLETPSEVKISMSCFTILAMVQSNVPPPRS